MPADREEETKKIAMPIVIQSTGRPIEKDEERTITLPKSAITKVKKTSDKKPIKKIAKKPAKKPSTKPIKSSKKKT